MRRLIFSTFFHCAVKGGYCASLGFDWLSFLTSSNVLSISSIAATMRSGSVDRIEMDRACRSLSANLVCPGSKPLNDSIRPGIKLFLSGIALANAAHSALASVLTSFSAGRSVKKETTTTARNDTKKVIRIWMNLRSLIDVTRFSEVETGSRSPQNVPRLGDTASLGNSGGLTNDTIRRFWLYLLNVTQQINNEVYIVRAMSYRENNLVSTDFCKQEPCHRPY
jgi:hypothetical protein